MLLDLKIKDFAIIEDITVPFGPGLNVFTGETGAGKSIIIGAINLILGDRAQADLIRSGRDEAQVEALFEMEPKSVVGAILEEAGIRAGANLVVRRIIQRAGRNKIYINGSIATLVTLTEVGRHLIDIYGQSEHQSLTRREEHIEVLDVFADLAKSRDDMAHAFADWTGLKSELDGLRTHIKRATEDRDLLIFQSKEIGDAALSVDEEDKLGKEKEKLKNSETLHGATAAAEKFLYSDSGSVTERLGAVVKKLHETTKIDPSLAGTLEELKSAMISIEDAASTFRDYSSRIESNPARLEEVETRVDEIQKLKRKYSAASVKEILAKKDSIDKALAGVEGFEEQLKKLEGKEGASLEKAVKAAEKLSAQRTRAAKDLKKKLEDELAGLGMDGATFDVEITTDREDDGSARPGEKGADHVSFMISTNKGEDLKQLSRIASGGALQDNARHKEH